jgi:hypothetical protein
LGGGAVVETVCERMPNIGVLLLERYDSDAAARCWRIIVERELEAWVRPDR